MVRVVRLMLVVDDPCLKKSQVVKEICDVPLPLRKQEK
jgi:hypothetical protein